MSSVPCTLDLVNPEVTKDQVAQVEAVLGGGRVFGDVSKCRAVRTNRFVGMVQIGLAAATSIALATVLFTGSSMATKALWGLSLASGLAAMIQVRHVLSLMFKIGWHVFGTNTRANMVLTAVSVAAAAAYITARKSSMTAKGVLAVMLGVSLANVYYMSRNVLKPESMHTVAMFSALDRVLTARRLSALKKRA